ncbi:MAG: ribonuclease Z [Clostridia bacterium]|nr:ribonuclease Z [Clostridia bacterium]
MTIIVCIDDKNGMLFAGKRQSKDRILRERMLQHANGRTLWMSTYSASQFEEGGNFIADDDYAVKAATDDVCFVENGAIPLDKADRLIIYHWNRHYPATTFWTIDPAAEGFSLRSTHEFTGFSHDLITEEIFER